MAIWVQLSKKPVKVLKVYPIYRFVLVCSETFGTILCQMFSIYQEIQAILLSHDQMICIFRE